MKDSVSCISICGEAALGCRGDFEDTPFTEIVRSVQRRPLPSLHVEGRWMSLVVMACGVRWSKVRSRWHSRWTDRDEQKTMNYESNDEWIMKARWILKFYEELWQQIRPGQANSGYTWGIEAGMASNACRVCFPFQSKEKDSRKLIIIILLENQ
jgi:hypothetical protein